MSEPNWAEFRLPEEPDRQGINSEFDAICVSVFSSVEGKRLLAALHQKYFDAPISPHSDDRALRVRATQQHFVRELEIARDRGLAAAVQRKAR